MSGGTVRAWRAHALGEAAAVLRLDEVEAPSPGQGEVVIEVEAVGLNFPDVLLLRGQYQERPPLPFTPGLEVAGTVVALGPGARMRIGQRVAAIAGPPEAASPSRSASPPSTRCPSPTPCRPRSRRRC